jgi:hypothetical protein
LTPTRFTARRFSVLRSEHQRRSGTAVASVDVGAGGKQTLQQSQVPPRSRCHQGRSAIGGAAVDIGLLFEQRSQRRSIAFADRSQPGIGRTRAGQPGQRGNAQQSCCQR